MTLRRGQTNIHKPCISADSDIQSSCPFPTIRHNVGVRLNRTVEFQRLDEDFFTEDE
jgi:hypothetical protein